MLIGILLAKHWICSTPYKPCDKPVRAEFPYSHCIDEKGEGREAYGICQGSISQSVFFPPLPSYPYGCSPPEHWLSESPIHRVHEFNRSGWGLRIYIFNRFLSDLGILKTTALEAGWLMSLLKTHPRAWQKGLVSFDVYHLAFGATWAGGAGGLLERSGS